jgi:hypothetical protein
MGPIVIWGKKNNLHAGILIPTVGSMCIWRAVDAVAA